MAVGDAHVFLGFLTPVLPQLFFPKPPTTFLTCFCRGERRKYAGKKVRPNRGLKSQPPGHESDTLTIEPPMRGNSKQACIGALVVEIQTPYNHLSNQPVVKSDALLHDGSECITELSTIIMILYTDMIKPHFFPPFLEYL